MEGAIPTHKILQAAKPLSFMILLKQFPVDSDGGFGALCCGDVRSCFPNAASNANVIWPRNNYELSAKPIRSAYLFVDSATGLSKNDAAWPTATRG